MTFSVQRLSEPLLLNQVVLDPTWNKFKTYFGVCVGGFAFMAWVVYLSFQWGSAGHASVAIQQLPVVATVPQPQLPPTAVSQAPPPLLSVELSPEELDRRHSEYLRRRSQ